MARIEQHVARLMAEFGKGNSEFGKTPLIHASFHCFGDFLEKFENGAVINRSAEEFSLALDALRCASFRLVYVGSFA